MRDRLAVLVDHHRRVAHDITARPVSRCRSDGMAGHARQAFVLKGPFARHALRKIAREQRHRIVASLAMPGELHTFFIDEHIHILEVPGSAKAVRVGGLAPLAVALLVAMTAILRGGKAFRAHEFAVVGGCVRWQERRLFPKGIVVLGGDVNVILGRRDSHPGGYGGGAADGSGRAAEGAFIGGWLLSRRGSRNRGLTRLCRGRLRCRLLPGSRLNRANRREGQSCEAEGSKQHPESARCRKATSLAVCAIRTAGQLAEKVVVHQLRVPLEWRNWRWKGKK